MLVINSVQTYLSQNPLRTCLTNHRRKDLQVLGRASGSALLYYAHSSQYIDSQIIPPTLGIPIYIDTDLRSVQKASTVFFQQRSAGCGNLAYMHFFCYPKQKQGLNFNNNLSLNTTILVFTTIITATIKQLCSGKRFFKFENGKSIHFAGIDQFIRL